MNNDDFILTTDVLTMGNSSSGSGTIVFPGSIVIPASPPPYVDPGVVTMHQDILVPNSLAGSITLSQFDVSGPGYDNRVSYYGNFISVSKDANFYFGTGSILINFYIVQVSKDIYRLQATALNYIDGPATLHAGNITVSVKVKSFVPI